uniref:Uncharacterized protein n=1 Tax=Timema cristinae TaxID=61476 RepID=A0A7R9CRU6_TIMCR|nr:unnamed protein product [Timema cristinae]
MERWSGKVALVTGASSGIGAAIAQELVKHGLKVVGLARRVEKVEELEAVLKSAPGKLYAVKADVAKEEEILAAFEWIKKNLGGVDILINNAGVGTAETLSDTGNGSWHVLDVNVKALRIFTREALKSMKERTVNDGHIIHINSTLGHSLPTGRNVSMYHASKHAVIVLTEGLRRELVQLGSKIKVTSVSPGVTVTEFMNLYGEERKKRLYAENPTLQAKDIADAVVYTLGTPPHVQKLVMERWSGKVALVTGASVGIGAAIVEELVRHGVKVVGLARRVEKVEELAAGLNNAPGKLYALKADASKEEDILAAFDWIKKNLGGVHILINNAGLGTAETLSNVGDISWRVLELNVKALSIFTREALKSMKERGVNDGHIIHINRYHLFSVIF